jgi:hypothetical protein
MAVTTTPGCLESWKPVAFRPRLKTGLALSDIPVNIHFNKGQIENSHLISFYRNVSGGGLILHGQG